MHYRAIKSSLFMIIKRVFIILFWDLINKPYKTKTKKYKSISLINEYNMLINARAKSLVCGSNFAVPNKIVEQFWFVLVKRKHIGTDICSQLLCWCHCTIRNIWIGIPTLYFISSRSSLSKYRPTVLLVSSWQQSRIVFVLRPEINWVLDFFFSI